MSVRAEIRDLHGDTRPLDFVQEDEPYMVGVPGFGVLLVGRRTADPGRGVWAALLVQPDSERRFTAASNKAARDVVVVGGSVSSIDSTGTVHVRWDSGSTLGLCVEAGDRFEVIG